MARRKPKASEPVDVDELKDAILRLIVERFGDRHLTWETAEKALSIANFEIKHATLKAISEHATAPKGVAPSVPSRRAASRRTK